MIVEYKKQSNSKYGDAVISKFSEELSFRFGKGFEKSNIFRMIKFYEILSKMAPAPQSNKFPLAESFKNITWSNYREILTLNDTNIKNCLI